MTHITKWGTAAWVSAGVLATPAYAVTPEEVWQNWQDMGTAMGQAVVAGAASRAGDTLTITDATFASASGGVTAEGSIAQIVMQDQGDGKVLVTMSPEYPIKLRLPNTEAGAPEIEVNITVLSDGLEMIASGEAQAISYGVTAPEIRVNLQQIQGVDGASAGLTLDAKLTDLAGVYAAVMDGGKMTANSDFTIAGLTIASSGTDAQAQSELRLTAAITGLVLQSKGALTGALAGTPFATGALAQQDSATTITAQSSEFDAQIVDAAGTTTLTGTGGAMAVDSSISGGVMRYDTRQDALAVMMNAPNIPLPDLSVTLDQYAISLTSPLVAADAAQPFAFATRLSNLALSDQLWALFDPSGQLPRDPINLVIDTDGMALLTADSFGAGGGADLPNLESLNIKELRLALAGAELTGSGASTFAQAAGEGAMPDAKGKLDLTLTGANALMNKVVAAGLISPEALTMPRMMLAMLASPAADGSDRYTSTIEIKDKSIFANGQMLHQME